MGFRNKRLFLNNLVYVTVVYETSVKVLVKVCILSYRLLVISMFA